LMVGIRVRVQKPKGAQPAATRGNSETAGLLLLRRRVGAYPCASDSTRSRTKPGWPDGPWLTNPEFPGVANDRAGQRAQRPGGRRKARHYRYRGHWVSRQATTGLTLSRWKKTARLSGPSCCR